MSSNTESLNQILDTIGNSKSGKALSEAILNLGVLIRENDSVRDQLFSRREQLILLLKAYFTRKRKSLADSTRKRFEEPDRDLFNLIMIWEHDFGKDYPVLSSWIAHERSRGVNIPSKSIEANKAEEYATVRTGVKIMDLAETCKEVSKVYKELEQLLGSFTPGLEEAFANLDETMSQPFEPTEVQGENDDLFVCARERFDYLTRKLIPKLEVMIKELESTSQGKEGAKLLISIQSSPTYLNFLMLLSKCKRSGPRKKRLKLTGADNEYDDWF